MGFNEILQNSNNLQNTVGCLNMTQQKNFTNVVIV